MPHNDKTAVILLVDDSADDRFFFKEAFETAGARATFREVGTAEDAIAYLSGQGEFSDREKWPTPDLCFVDIKLPVKSGFDVLESVRSARRSTFPIIIMMSASVDPRDVDRAYELLANGYLVKPGSLDELIELLISAGRFWLRSSLFPNRVE